jgi:hypothetical protein
VVAETRDIDAGDLASLKHRHPLGDLHWVSVHEDLDGVLRIGKVDSGSGHRGPRRKIRRGFRLGLCSR